MRKCRVGIIGAGRMADFHLQVLTAFEDVEVVALANQRNAEKAQSVCQKYGIPKHYQDYKRMLDMEKPDAAVVAVSIVGNFEVTKECLSRGIPTLIEKPPGITVEETMELKNIAEAKKVIHLVGLQRRFSSHIREGIRIIKERGPIHSIVVEAPERFGEIKAKNKFPEKVLKSWIFANGIHCIDMLPYIGGPVAQVVASAQAWDETLHPDSLHALFKFENQASGHYIANWSSPGGWSVKIYGKGCRVDIQPLERGRVIYADGTEKDLPIDKKDVAFKPGLYAQDRMFIDACLKKGKIGHPAATLREGLEAMQLAEKIMSNNAGWKQGK